MPPKLPPRGRRCPGFGVPVLAARIIPWGRSRVRTSASRRPPGESSRRPGVAAPGTSLPSTTRSSLPQSLCVPPLQIASGFGAYRLVLGAWRLRWVLAGVLSGAFNDGRARTLALTAGARQAVKRSPAQHAQVVAYSANLMSCPWKTARKARLFGASVEANWCRGELRQCRFIAALKFARTSM